MASLKTKVVAVDLNASAILKVSNDTEEDDDLPRDLGNDIESVKFEWYHVCFTIHNLCSFHEHSA